MSEHPSYLELDRVALGAGDEAAAAHVSTCARCADHVAAVKTAPSPAAWVTRIEPAPPRWRRLSWQLSLGVALCAAAAALVLVVRPRPTPDAPGGYVGAKGTDAPAVWLYVNRGGEVALWDGVAAVQPGDRVRLKIDPARFAHAAVLGTGGDDGAALLWSGTLPPRTATALPVAWTIDERGADERLVVVLSHRALDAAEARRTARDAGDGASAGAWVGRFVLPKRGR